MVNRKMLLAACGAAAFALVWASGAAAMADGHQTTYLTFSRRVMLRGVALSSGTYTFEIANPDTSADIVRVSSRDGSLVYFMGFTRAIARPNGISPDLNVTI